MKDSEVTQFTKPYESTIAFQKLLSKLNLLNKKTKNIIDIGTGIGSNLQYFSSKNKNIKFLGTDYEVSRLKKGEKLNTNPKIKFKKLNILKSVKSFQNKFDGLISIHTLCCFKELDVVIKNFCKIKPKWIAINSLFFDGPLDVLIHIRDHENKKIKDDNPNSDFNIFSLTKIEEIFKKNGYKIIKKNPYFPKQKIKGLNKGKRGSYTIKTDMHKNTTFSGPVYLPWYFVVAKKVS
jgi:ubiquinone/menaquinone biosynthesis C-methylase UbiE